MKNGYWVVHKFGGTSVQNAERYLSAAKIILSEINATNVTPATPRPRCAVVVSAMKGVTDALYALVHDACHRDEGYLTRLDELKNRHLDTIAQLVNAPLRTALSGTIESDFRDLKEILRGVWLVRTAPPRVVDLIAGFGEVWSAQILNAVFQQQGHKSAWIDAREVVVVNHNDNAVAIDWQSSSQKMSEWLNKNPSPELAVVTGFVAATADGIMTTLGRNGSDYSASIFGALLEVQEITIWTDVDGVMSADPRLVPYASVLDEVSYHEVMELAYFGAKVVHPATMEPAIRRNIPVWIRNTFNPTARGTKIHGQCRSAEAPVKGFSAIDDMALVNVEGTGMAGVPGISEKLFGALRQAGISVTMISQASSEASICFAIPDKQAELAKQALEKTFYSERHQGIIQRIDVTTGCSILAVVGDGMKHHSGIAGRFFRALGKAGINVRAIAQGSSERNISAVIQQEDTIRALRAVHSGFYLSNQTISLGIIGTGLIGKAFLGQIQEQLDFLKSRRNIDIRVRGIMNSRQMILNDKHIPLDDWRQLIEKGEAPDLEKFTAHLQSGHVPHSVILDITASDVIPKLYAQWMRRGLNIITPNKRANTGSLSYYQELRAAARESKRYFLYATNVGAGLPVIHTMRDLHYTGDKIIRVEGVFSGTLAYIFNSFTADKHFSEIVFEAKRLGYTEPDPRDDLSGMDVARKLVILAREMGMNIEISDVEIQSLVPKDLQGCSLEDYLKNLPKHDDAMTAVLRDARDKNHVLRYVGVIDPTGRAKVQLSTYPNDHSFARIKGSDNIVAFTTARYETQPLVIQGPGAGPEVTAAGIFADLLKFASFVGAPQ